jgi:hypothetical protein
MPVPSGADIDLELPSWARMLVVLAVGIALSGLADFALSRAGYANLAAFAWATGYAGTIIILWLGWGRHLDLVGDTGVGHESDSDESTPAEEPEPPESY